MMKNYTNTDQQLHLLCQIIAKANRTFVPKKEDDSHTNLYFDTLGNRITGRWINTTKNDILFTLNLENLDFEIVDRKQQILATLATIGHKIDDIEKEIELQLPSLGLNVNGFKEELHFEIPVYNFREKPIAAISSDALSNWKYYRQLANEACALVLGYAQVYGEIRIWPHHFDTGIYININPNLGLGFGLAMEDDMVGAPYFYMSGYAKNSTISYDNLPKGNGWKWEVGEHWNGAVLSLNQLKNKTNEEQKMQIQAYLLEAFNWFAKQK